MRPALPPRLLLALLCAAVCAGCKRPPDSTTIPPSASGPAWFEEITEQAGVDFIHDPGASGSYFMPESMGSGGALFDFDQDGRLDLYLVQCGGLNSPSRNQLFHQQTDGRFRNVSAGSGLDIAGHGMGAAIGDVDNDGQPDVLVTEFTAARLFLNTGGGKFTEATSAAGIDVTRWATAAAFFDYDRDGWLDLVVVTYVDYGPAQRCYDAAGAPEYCGPEGLAGTAARLFRNVSGAGGSVRFEDVTAASGLARATQPGLGVLCADFDGDRWPDIFVASDGAPNRLFINQRNGGFIDEAVTRGLAFNAMGGTAANMGAALGDADGDGAFDVFVTHLFTEQHGLWAQGPRGLFQERTAAAGLANPAWRGTGFGTVLADFDHDGAPDLALVNGGVKRGREPAPRVAGMNPRMAAYAQRNQLFANDGRGRFRDISAANPAFCGRASVGRGLAVGDLDGDGALDLLAVNAGSPARLFRNVAPARGRWLLVRAVDPALGGRDAYGAEVTVEAGGRRWQRLVQPSFSYLSSSDPRAHFGLGAATKVEAIRVVWPEGAEEVFAGGAVDRALVLRKGEGMKP